MKLAAFALPLRCVALIVVMLSAACSTADRNFPQMQETLAIELMPDTSKQFVYTLRLPAGAAPDPLVAKRRREGDRRPSQPDLRTYQRLQENVDQALTRTGYCRDGYLELDRRLALHTLWLRGECREGATEEDVSHFGQRQTLPLDQPAGR